jgi:hypothetical protein
MKKSGIRKIQAFQNPISKVGISDIFSPSPTISKQFYINKTIVVILVVGYSDDITIGVYSISLFKPSDLHCLPVPSRGWVGWGKVLSHTHVLARVFVSFENV